MKDAKYYIFSDDEYFNREIQAKSWREALKQARDMFQIKGRLLKKVECGYCREYRLIGSDYGFTLRVVFN